jgi:hypothetical protein
MALKFEVPTSLDYFRSLVQDDDHFPLLEAAACIAQDEYPDLDVQQVLGDVDQLLARLKRRRPMPLRCSGCAPSTSSSSATFRSAATSTTTAIPTTAT